jgi:hypothetical protein
MLARGIPPAPTPPSYRPRRAWLPGPRFRLLVSCIAVYTLPRPPRAAASPPPLVVDDTSPRPGRQEYLVMTRRLAVVVGSRPSRTATRPPGDCRPRARPHACLLDSPAPLYDAHSHTSFAHFNRGARVLAPFSRRITTQLLVGFACFLLCACFFPPPRLGRLTFLC